MLVWWAGAGRAEENLEDCGEEMTREERRDGKARCRSSEGGEVI